MTDALFAHVGGAVVCDHGPLPLVEARAMSITYAREAEYWFGAGAIEAGRACARRAIALCQTADEAARWRRAAGWRDPEMADTPLTTLSAIKSLGLGARQH